ncbi:hypothetical protein LGN21_37190 [Burkholderia cepacia]|uniref:hypothetical protein n=1 Tax=Burkholderia cepacia TaxID=292 RepID=UPI001CF1AC28|nr:hypothetical protein [Burkholderia cepacia]MCA8285233.1 hypothetical protein [Burkholderia cepacia]
MKDLTAYLRSICSCANIDFEDQGWASNADIRAEPGWYFIRTTAPLDVLQRQTLWGSLYTRADGKVAKVNNINIAARAARYSSDLQSYWNVTDVYSGMASKLHDRTREHTTPDPGTGGLALARYPELHQFQWQFFFVTLRRFREEISCTDMLLRLGEQMWRAENGWPLLCSR